MSEKSSPSVLKEGSHPSVDSIGGVIVKPKILVTRRIPPPGIEMLQEVCDVEVRERPQPPNVEELARRIRDFDGLLCLLTDTVDAQVLDAAPHLRVISSYSVGYDHIDVAAATRKGVYVTYTPGVLTETTADLAWSLLLCSARRVVEADNYVRRGVWAIGWSPDLLLGADVYGKTLGIVGLGRIGQAVAARAVGFNMRVLYQDVVRASPQVEEKFRLRYASLDELLSESDFISLHIPLSKDSFHLINEERLKLMKPNATLINTSRGAVIDQKALAKTLRERRIAAAALDVFEKEPIDKSDPLLRMNNVVLLPHLGSATREARSRMAQLAASNLLSVLKGEIPPHLVNPEVQRNRPLASVKMI